MTERTRLLTSPTEAEILNFPADREPPSAPHYGSIESPPPPQDNQPPDEPMDDSKTTLKFFEKIGFSLGHIYNDLCAGVWFSYTLLFMQNVLQMPSYQAGALVMLGQVGDAIATPIVGMLTDKYSTKRKWHVFGTFLVLLTFPLIFAVCPFCDVMPSWWKLSYFSFVILIFQFGWPVVQIAHLAMIPELSRTQRDRSDLTATRYSASICSNVVVYIVTWAVLHIQTTYENKISPSDWPKFRVSVRAKVGIWIFGEPQKIKNTIDIAVILTLIGVSMSVLFQFSLSLSNYEYRRRLTIDQRNQPLPQSSNSEIGNHSADEPATDFDPDDDKMIKANDTAVAVIAKKNFFKSPLLYQNALLYVFSRLFMTTSLVYMPLWLNERSYTPPSNGSSYEVERFLGDSKNIENIATVPLASFVASFVASMIIKQTDRAIGHKVSYLIGSFISFCGCAWVSFAATPSSPMYELYIVAIFFGAGSSITMITALCITADMIGPHADQGGFIYSAVTFCDKLITGVAVVVIETIKCKNHDDCPTYYRNVLAYACGVPAILGILVLFTLNCTKASRRRDELEERRTLL